MFGPEGSFLSRHALPRRSPRDIVAREHVQKQPAGAAGTTSVTATPGRYVPARKPAFLLSAAVVGALLAASPLGAGAAERAMDATTTVMAAPLDATMVSGPAGGAGEDANDEMSARQELTAADAEARLVVLRADRAQRASRAAAARVEAARPRFVLPAKGRLSSCFCERWGTMHWGIDIAAPMLTPIRAVADAVVVKAGAASGYGNVVELQHEDGTVSRYGHMETVEVSVGDIVSAGDLIARVGSRGFSTGPHLHLEIYPQGLTGDRVDPKQWLADRGIVV